MDRLARRLVPESDPCTSLEPRPGRSDIAEAIILIATTWFAVRRTSWTEISATAIATMLILDAWFDATTAASAWPVAVSLLLA